MSSTVFTESLIEDAALTWLASLGYAVQHGPEIAPGELRVKETPNIQMEAFNG